MFLQEKFQEFAQHFPFDKLSLNSLTCVETHKKLQHHDYEN